MGYVHLQFILFFVCLVFLPTTKGAIFGSCMTPLENIAVHEGNLSTFISYSGSHNGVKLTTIATTDEISDVVIVNNNDAVDPNYATDYAFDALGLTIKNATTKDEPGHKLSTAGYYTVECGGKRSSFKFLVVRQAPTSSIRTLDATTVEVTCSAIYGDSTYDPIAAIFTLYVDDDPIATDTPQRTNNDAWTWISTSKFTTAYNRSSTYQCSLTFGQPTEVQDPIVAMNPPKFNHFSLGGNIPKDINGKCVVKAELYERCKGCCPGRSACGVVVTTRGAGRYLIHESLCDDKKCEMIVVGASSMSSNWKLLTGKDITRSEFGDFIDAGNSVPIAQRKTDCREYCKRMMNLP